MARNEHKKVLKQLSDAYQKVLGESRGTGDELFTSGKAVGEKSLAARRKRLRGMGKLQADEPIEPSHGPVKDEDDPLDDHSSVEAYRAARGIAGP